MVRALLEEHRDKPSQDKLRLVGATGEMSVPGNTALLRAVSYGRAAVVDALLDPKWWKDDEALVALIECKQANETVLTNSYYRENQPKLVEKVEKALAAARKK